MKVQADYKYSSSARKPKKMKDGNFKGYIKYYSWSKLNEPQTKQNKYCQFVKNDHTYVKNNSCDM
jgi:hypothetical protein